MGHRGAIERVVDIDLPVFEGETANTGVGEQGFAQGAVAEAGEGDPGAVETGQGNDAVGEDQGRVAADQEDFADQGALVTAQAQRGIFVRVRAGDAQPQALHPKLRADRSQAAGERAAIGEPATPVSGAPGRRVPGLHGRLIACSRAADQIDAALQTGHGVRVSCCLGAQ